MSEPGSESALSETPKDDQTGNRLVASTGEQSPRTTPGVSRHPKPSGETILKLIAEGRHTSLRGGIRLTVAEARELYDYIGRLERDLRVALAQPVADRSPSRTEREQG